MSVLLSACRYQPGQPSRSYTMANTQEEPEVAESSNEGSVNILPPPEDRFTIKNLFAPSNKQPSTQSGFAVKICTGVLGETLKHSETD